MGISSETVRLAESMIVILAGSYFKILSTRSMSKESILPSWFASASFVGSLDPAAISSKRSLSASSIRSSIFALPKIFSV